MKNRLLLFFLSFICVSMLQAEGTRQVAPNGSISINGSPTTDIAALWIANPDFNNFAAYDNNSVQGRLHINIQDPSNECIFLGFSFGHFNVTGPNPNPMPFEYRVIDPNGNVVFGPVVVNPGNTEINSWSEGFIGPMQVNGAGGYDATVISSADLMSQGWSGEGDYYIQFDTNDPNDQGFLIDFWDITVADCSGPNPVEKLGRIWSFNWALFAINDFGFPNRPFNGSFYVCAPDPDNANAAFVTKIDFNGSGFRPAAFNVAFNSFGAQNTGNVMVDRRSVDSQNTTQSEYSVFLNDPVDICETAETGEIELLGISRCSEVDYCIKFVASKEGQIDLLLDFDGPDNIYTPGTADVMVTADVSADQVGQAACIDWDGLDGLGNPIPEDEGTEIPITISYAQGIYHFPIYDAEFLTEGFMLEAIRPTGDVPLLYYDDSNIAEPSGSGEPSVQLAGCTIPCHTWNDFIAPGAGFGETNTINSWWFSQQIVRQDVYLLPAYYECSIDAPEEVCAGQEVEVSLLTQAFPESADPANIISIDWMGGNIVNVSGTSAVINGGGALSAEATWLTELGDTCSTICEVFIDEGEAFFADISESFCEGESVEINEETYSESGEYQQVLTASNGCDSTLNIVITVLENSEEEFNFEFCEGDSVEFNGEVYSEAGEYEQVLSASNECDSVLLINVTVNPNFTNEISFVIDKGDTLEYNGVEYTEAGVYNQDLETQNGCDSILIINLLVETDVVSFPLDSCEAIFNVSNNDFTEFVPEYPDTLDCGQTSASIVYRNEPEENGHSCTPGVEDTPAMCVSAVDACEYEAGDVKSLIFDITVVPDGEQAIHITGLSFYEQAPESFDWIDGNSGPNNYPTKYALRVLRNGTEIYGESEIETTTEWTLETFSFVDDEDFVVGDTSILSFELLAYCLVGNGSPVAAWDIDQIDLQASCTELPQVNRVIKGSVTSENGAHIKDVRISRNLISEEPQLEYAFTNVLGQYSFDQNLTQEVYEISPYKNSDFLNGVSTLDLIMIQKHVIGISPLESPYQMIAADISRDNSISALDLVQLRKLILGVYEELPNNTSWRFADSDQSLDIENPWIVKETRILDPLKRDEKTQDFVAIKIGDINRNASGLKSDKTFVLSTFEKSQGSNHLIDLNLVSNEEIIGMQMSFEIEGAELLDITSDLLDINESHYSFVDNILKISWNQNSSLLLDKESSLIRLVLSNKPTKAVQLSTKAMNSEVYKYNGLYSSENIELELRDSEPVEASVFSLSQNQPNPFVDETNISFTLESDEMVQFVIYDLAGNKILQENISGIAGINNILVSKNDLNNMAGVFIYTLRSKDQMVSKRLVSLK